MLTMRLPFRGVDAWGSGAYKAPRGSKKHSGIDYAVEPGSYILSPCIGEVNRLGYSYDWVENGINYRFVEIIDLIGNKHQIHYITPLVIRGELVTVLTSIGIAQDISQKYIDPKLSPMKPHIHYAVYNKKGETIDPESFHV